MSIQKTTLSEMEQKKGKERVAKVLRKIRQEETIELMLISLEEILSNKLKVRMINLQFKREILDSLKGLISFRRL